MARRHTTQTHSQSVPYSRNSLHLRILKAIVVWANLANAKLHLSDTCIRLLDAFAFALRLKKY
jgi:hypothetical protein